MKSLLLVSCLLLLPQSSLGLSCVLQTMNQEVYDRLDLIVQGTVRVKDGSWQRDAASMNRVPFTVEVKKAWKGAKAGDSVKVEYIVFGGDGFPFRDGQKTIVMANSNDGAFRLNGCTMAVDYPMPEDMKEFSQNPAYFDKSKEQPDHIKEMQKRLENLPVDTLNKLKASADKSVGG